MMTSEILPGRLYQSGIMLGPEDWRFNVIVNLDFTCDVPPYGWDGSYLHFPFADVPSLPNETILRAVAHGVANLVKDEKRVLVRCQQGLNRSGVVIARALMFLGASADTAITQVRKSRGEWALSNGAFVDWLHEEERAQGRE